MHSRSLDHGIVIDFLFVFLSSFFIIYYLSKKKLGIFEMNSQLGKTVFRALS